MTNRGQNDKKEKPRIVITKIPFTYQFYFQWFMVGLYLIKNSKKIDVKFRVSNLLRSLSLLISNEIICKGLFAFEYFIITKRRPGYDYCMEGYFVHDGLKKSFCIDCSDAPYSFDSDLLDKVDVYFKMQCPKEFDPDGFPLSNDVKIPYCNTGVNGIIDNKRLQCTNLFQNIDKVKPAMIGIRRLSFSNSSRALIKSYKAKISSSASMKKGKAMCYFGAAKGPVAGSDYSPENLPDTIREGQIMSYYHDKLNHPNEKRKIVTNILKSLGSEYDARLIRDGESDSQNGQYHSELVIPLEKFGEHVSQYEYNVNISGYRMSIPNRFMDSFMVGTAIFTDKLFVKWYKPFDKNEVIETVQMGYLPENEVDWEKYKKDLLSLPPVDGDEVLRLFYEKWAPDVFAEYVIRTLRNTKGGVGND